MATRNIESRFYRWADLFAIFCLISLTYLNVFSLESTNWTGDLSHVTTITILGLLFGFLIGYAHISNWLSSLLIFLYSSVIFFLQFIIFLNSYGSWNEKLLEYIGRITQIFYELFENIPVSDGLLFSSGAGAIFLFTSMIMGFRFVRYKKIGFSFYIQFILFILIQFYIPKENRSLAVIFLFVFFLLLFFHRHFLLKKRYEWMSDNIREDEGELIKISRRNVLVILVICFFSIGLPNIQNYIFGFRGTQSDAGENEAGVISEFWNNFFNPLSEEEKSDQELFLDNLALGTDIPVLREKVFEISIEGNNPKLARYYWQGKIYSYYDNGKWFSENVMHAVYPDSELTTFNQENQNFQEFSLVFSKPINILPVPQYVYDVDESLHFSYNQTGRNYKDIISIGDEFTNYQEKSVSYSGAYNMADYQELQNSGTDYPAWVEERYLQLPENFSERIRNLSLEVSENYSTPIEKVQAMTDYLRGSYKYSDKVSVPENNDPVEWFLFEKKEGFCNYFASAEVLMLRSIGIPARLVSGYSQGEKESEQNIYIIYALNKHAWVEVFFPEIGWIIFEPTPNQPETSFFTRDKSDLNAGPRNPGDIEFENFQNSRGIPVQSEIDGLNQEDDFSNTVRKIVIRRYLLRAGLASILLISMFSILSWLVFREKKNKAPFVLRKYLEKAGMHVPEWIDKWEDYEGLSISEKYYHRLKKISESLLKNDLKNDTPFNFLANLFTRIHLADESADLFIRSYLNDAYGKGSRENYSDVRAIYFTSISLIYRTFIKDTIQKISSLFPFRLLFNR